MPTVKNNTSQPCYIYLLKGRSVKIPSRGTAEVAEDDMKCPDMAHHIKCGNLVETGNQAAKGGSGSSAGGGGNAVTGRSNKGKTTASRAASVEDPDNDIRKKPENRGA